MKKIKNKYKECIKFSTFDNNLTIKTITEEDFHQFKNNFKKYYDYSTANSTSLLVKIYGIFVVC